MINLIAVGITFVMACSTPDLISESDSSPIEAPTTIGFLETTECSYSVGDKACDFQLRDQDDSLWRLDSHLGDVVLIDLSAMWCGPCQHAATTAQSTQDLYEAYGFHYVTVLIDDPTGEPIESADLGAWSESYGILTAPILEGSRDLLQSGGATNGFPVTSWPTFILVNRNQEVVWGLRGFNEATILEAIDEHI